jgi:hypothetical protein
MDSQPAVVEPRQTAVEIQQTNPDPSLFMMPQNGPPVQTQPAPYFRKTKNDTLV